MLGTLQRDVVTVITTRHRCLAPVSEGSALLLRRFGQARSFNGTTPPRKLTFPTDSVHWRTVSAASEISRPERFADTFRQGTSRRIMKYRHKVVEETPPIEVASSIITPHGGG